MLFPKSLCDHTDRGKQILLRRGSAKTKYEKCKLLIITIAEKHGAVPFALSPYF
jgi:hypothetical protein